MTNDEKITYYLRDMRQKGVQSWTAAPLAYQSSLASRHQGQATAFLDFSVAFLALGRLIFVCFSFTLASRQPLHLGSGCVCRGCGVCWGDYGRDNSTASAKTGVATMGGLSEPMRRREAAPMSRRKLGSSGGKPKLTALL